ncbi:hypothetical protein ACN27J_18285 [Solwaraspora sp. WMMB762]|uniref:hypothetical protein n=1 Tax=Solwaraspora sp. WMMB762 TaxID=3404120 RepID=UPI003B92DD24
MTITPTHPPAPAPAYPSASLTADAILALHTPDDTLMCAQCRFEGRLTPHPCTHRRWADAVDRSTPTRDTLIVLGLLGRPPRLAGTAPTPDPPTEGTP